MSMYLTLGFHIIRYQIYQAMIFWIVKVSPSLLNSFTRSAKPHYILAALLDPSEAYLLDIASDDLIALLKNELDLEGSSPNEEAQLIQITETNPSAENSFKSYRELMAKKRQQDASVNSLSTHNYRIAKDYIQEALSNVRERAEVYWSNDGSKKYVSLLEFSQLYFNFRHKFFQLRTSI